MLPNMGNFLLQAFSNPLLSSPVPRVLWRLISLTDAVVIVVVDYSCD